MSSILNQTSESPLLSLSTSSFNRQAEQRLKKKNDEGSKKIQVSSWALMIHTPIALSPWWSTQEFHWWEPLQKPLLLSLLRQSTATMQLTRWLADPGMGGVNQGLMSPLPNPSRPLSFAPMYCYHTNNRLDGRHCIWWVTARPDESSSKPLSSSLFRADVLLLYNWPSG